MPPLAALRSSPIRPRYRLLTRLATDDLGSPRSAPQLLSTLLGHVRAPVAGSGCRPRRRTLVATRRVATARRPPTRPAGYPGWLVPKTSTRSWPTWPAACTAALEAAGLPAAEPEFERPRQAEHGDWATSVALRLAKPAKQPPRAIAEALVANLELPDGVEAVDIAGPGFVNFRFSHAYLEDLVRTVVARGDAYGRRERADGERERINVEFVSANPTGPLHVGSGRWAATGDALAELLEADGNEVSREYYVNDAGEQVRRFGESIVLVARGEPLGEDHYRGATSTSSRPRSAPSSARSSSARATASDRSRTTASAGRCRRPRRGTARTRRPPRTASRPASPPTSPPRSARRACARCGTGSPTRCGRWASSTTSGSASGSCTRAARSSRPSRSSSTGARPTSRTARSSCAPPTTATTRTGCWCAPTGARPTSPPTAPTCATSGAAATRGSSTCSAPTTTATSAG